MARAILARFTQSHERKLLALQKTEPGHRILDKWGAKAIKTLVKVLRKKRGTLKELERTIMRQDQNSGCIVVPRSFDPQVLVSHRRSLPHVTYCRLWRWPDLQSLHQVRSCSNCKYPYDPIGSTPICINPFHYERIEPPPLPPIYVPILSPNHIPPDLSTSLEDCDEPPPEKSRQKSSNHPPTQPQVYQDDTSRRTQSSSSSGSGGIPQETMQQSEAPSDEVHPMSTGHDINKMESSDQLNRPTPQELTRNLCDINQHAGYHASQPDYPPQGQLSGQPPGQLPDQQTGQQQPQQSAQMTTQLNPCQAGPSNQSIYPHQPTDIYSQQHQPCTSRLGIQGSFRPHDSYPVRPPEATQLDQLPSTSSQNKQSSPGVPQKELFSVVEFVESKHWCSILYYEYASRVGDKFQAETSSIIVDGFTDPRSKDRFCLGSLTNVNRSPIVTTVRRYIGNGVRLYNIDGEVYVECLSNSSVFVQSTDCNQRFKWHRATVCKVPHGCNLKIFNIRDFANLLSASVNIGYDAVYQLTKMCTMRLSFVKGWGQDYKRTSILSTPCWIEIQLTGPLEWIDRVLRRMRSPELTPGSSS